MVSNVPKNKPLTFTGTALLFHPCYLGFYMIFSRIILMYFSDYTSCQNYVPFARDILKDSCQGSAGLFSIETTGIVKQHKILATGIYLLEELYVSKVFKRTHRSAA